MPPEALSAPWAMTAGHTEPLRSLSQPKKIPHRTQPISMTNRPQMFGWLKSVPIR